MKVMGLPKDRFPISSSLDPVDKACDSHAHSNYEMFIVYTGSGVHTVDDIDYVIKPGDVFVIHRYIEHGFTQADNLLLYNFGFSETVLDGIGTEAKKIPGFNALFLSTPLHRHEPFAYMFSLNNSQMMEIIPVCKMLVEESKGDSPGFEVAARSLLFLLITQISRCFTEAEKDFTTGKYNAIQCSAATAYIEENYMDRITLDQLADITRYSKRHFSRIFKMHYFVSPTEYINNVRLESSKNYLKTTELSISEIADRVGFYDAAAFSKSFKAKYGITPHGYREK